MGRVSNQRAVVVDDEPLVAEVVARVVTSLAYDVEWFTEPHQALASIQDRAPAVVVSDFSMPKMTGVELLVEVKRTWPDVRRVLISGNLNQVDDAMRASISPCTVLAKPVGRSALLNALQASVVLE